MTRDISKFLAAAPEGPRKCWFHYLTPDEQADVNEAHDQGVSSTTIARVLTNEEHVINASRVRSHFSGGCKCPK